MKKLNNKQQKRLVLGRETVRTLSLSRTELEAVVGGQIISWNEDSSEDCVCKSGVGC
jgi:hypothetical protein